jgi:hypothetical protein
VSVRSSSSNKSDNLEGLERELYQLTLLIERRKAISPLNLLGLIDLAHFLDPFKWAFEEIYRLLFIALIFPYLLLPASEAFRR